MRRLLPDRLVAEHVACRGRDSRGVDRRVHHNSGKVRPDPLVLGRGLHHPQHLRQPAASSHEPRVRVREEGEAGGRQRRVDMLAAHLAEHVAAGRHEVEDQPARPDQQQLHERENPAGELSAGLWRQDVQRVHREPEHVAAGAAEELQVGPDRVVGRHHPASQHGQRRVPDVRSGGVRQVQPAAAWQQPESASG